MAYTFNGSTQYLTGAYSPVTVTPVIGGECTITADFNITALGRFNAWSYGLAGNTASFLINLELNGNINFGHNAAYYNLTNFGTGHSAISTNSWSLNTWTTVSCTEPAGTGNLQVDLLGTTTTGGSGSAALASQDTIVIGAQMTGSTGSVNAWFPGTLGHRAHWLGSLTSRQRDSLRLGFSPRLVQLWNLKSYFPLVNDLNDRCRRAPLTAVGAPTVARHNRVYGF